MVTAAQRLQQQQRELLRPRSVKPKPVRAQPREVDLQGQQARAQISELRARRERVIAERDRINTERQQIPLIDQGSRDKKRAMGIEANVLNREADAIRQIISEVQRTGRPVTNVESFIRSRRQNVRKRLTFEARRSERRKELVEEFGTKEGGRIARLEQGGTQAQKSAEARIRAARRAATQPIVEVIPTERIAPISRKSQVSDQPDMMVKITEISPEFIPGVIADRPESFIDKVQRKGREKLFPEAERERRLRETQAEFVGDLNKRIEEFEEAFGGRELSQKEFEKATNIAEGLDKQIKLSQDLQKDIDRRAKKREEKVGPFQAKIEKIFGDVNLEDVLSAPIRGVEGAASVIADKVQRFEDAIENRNRQFDDILSGKRDADAIDRFGARLFGTKQTTRGKIDLDSGTFTVDSTSNQFNVFDPQTLKTKKVTLKQTTKKEKEKALLIGSFIVDSRLGGVLLGSSAGRGLATATDPSRTAEERLSGTVELGVSGAILATAGTVKGLEAINKPTKIAVRTGKVKSPRVDLGTLDDGKIKIDSVFTTPKKVLVETTPLRKFLGLKPLKPRVIQQPQTFGVTGVLEPTSKGAVSGVLKQQRVGSNIVKTFKVSCASAKVPGSQRLFFSRCLVFQVGRTTKGKDFSRLIADQSKPTRTAGVSAVKKTKATIEREIPGFKLSQQVDITAVTDLSKTSAIKPLLAKDIQRGVGVFIRGGDTSAKATRTFKATRPLNVGKGPAKTVANLEVSGKVTSKLTAKTKNPSVTNRQVAAALQAQKSLPKPRVPQITKQVAPSRASRAATRTLPSAGLKIQEDVLVGTLIDSRARQRQRGVLDTREELAGGLTQGLFDILSQPQVKTQSQPQRPRPRQRQPTPTQLTTQPPTVNTFSTPTTTTVTTPRPPRTPKITGSPFRIDLPSSTRGRAGRGKPYDVFVGKKKVADNLSRRQALAFGSWVTDNSIAARFRIKKSGGRIKKAKVRFPQNYFTFNQNKFRRFKKRKGVKTPLVNAFIEKKNRRLDTAGEVAQISAARFISQQRRRFARVNLI